MKRQDGIALIASLLIMAAIMALGVGSLFLTNMNLRIAENGRTHAVARYNAEAGLEAALVKLKQDYKAVTPNQFPATLALPSSPNSTVTYQAVGSGSTYTPYTTGGFRTQARVIIIGVGPNNARYQTEALLGAASSASSGSGTTPTFPPGWISEGTVTTKGNTSMINAQLHGNGGIDMSGNASFKTCADATETKCTDLARVANPDGTFTENRPVSAAEAQLIYTCKTSGSGTSDLCAGIPAKPVVLKKKVTIGPPPYLSMRNDKDANNRSFNDVNNNGIKDTGEKDVVFGLTSAVTKASTNLSAVSPACTVNVTSASQLKKSYLAGSKVCINISGVVTFPDDTNYSGITVISKGDALIKGNPTFKDANLISLGTLTIEGNVTMENTRLLADTKTIIKGNVKYKGSATIASGGDLDLEGNIEHDPTSDIGMALMSNGNFLAKGNMEGKGSGSGKFVNVAVWAGGTATVEGNSAIRGGISAVGNIVLKGNPDIDGRGTFTNTDLLNNGGGAAMEVAALSRR